MRRAEHLHSRHARFRVLASLPARAGLCCAASSFAACMCLPRPSHSCPWPHSAEPCIAQSMRFLMPPFLQQRRPIKNRNPRRAHDRQGLQGTSSVLAAPAQRCMPPAQAHARAARAPGGPRPGQHTLARAPALAGPHAAASACLLERRRDVRGKVGLGAVQALACLRGALQRVSAPAGRAGP